MMSEMLLYLRTTASVPQFFILLKDIIFLFIDHLVTTCVLTSNLNLSLVGAGSVLHCTAYQEGALLHADLPLAVGTGRFSCGMLGQGAQSGNSEGMMA